MTRAWTRIDHGVAAVGNGLVERRWSLFLGRLEELRQVFPGRGHVEWLEGPGLDLDPAEFGAGEGPKTVPEWSESCSAFGAQLTLRRMAGPLVFTMDITVPHGLPAVIRETRVLNAGSAPVTVPRAVLESLPLRRDGAGVLDPDGVRHADGLAVAAGAFAPVAAELKGLGGIGALLGASAPVRCELFAPDPARCAVLAPGPVTLAPGRWWRGPAVFTVFYQGAPGAGTHRVLRELACLLEARERGPETDGAPTERVE
ncbi:MAG TPA: hypothetical protein PKL54_02340 [Candidatus Hydrogenedentes bacterium]|nr:hypothetical protein [Candidatus Hydrogenedentota bacterium]